MSKKRGFRYFFCYIVILVVISLPIVSFYLLSEVYSYHNRMPQRVVLDDAIFGNSDSEKNNYQVSKVDVAYPIYSSNVLADDSLIFSTANIDRNGEGIYNLDYSTNAKPESNPIFKGSNVINVSPDRQKVMFTNWGNGAEVSIYDFQTNEVISKYAAVKFCNWLPDSSAFIGIDQKSIFVQTLSSDIRTSIVETDLLYKSMLKSSIEVREITDAMILPWYDFKVSIDGKRLYILSWSEDSDSSLLFELNIENGDLSILPIDGYISGILPLNNGNLLFTGNIDGYEGMYLYAVKDKFVKRIIEDSIFSFNISPDNQRIAYGIIKDDKSHELYVASFTNGNLDSSKFIYSDKGYLNNLYWNLDGDKLFLVKSELGGSEIYTFTFENEEFF